MNKKDELDLYGEYTPQPFRFQGDAKTYSIVAAVVVAFIAGIILTQTPLSNVEENEAYPIFNFLILAGVVLLTLTIGYVISKARHKKNMEKERELFQRMKEEAVPYTVCEFCGGKIERKFYQAEDTVMSRYNHNKLGVETFVCEECRYLVKGHTCTHYLSSTVYTTEYTLVIPEVFETSKVSEQQLKEGRLVSYLRTKKRTGFIKKD